MTTAELDQKSIDTIRFLSVDMVQQAKSGHPGLPLGAAPMAYVLWNRFLKHNPKDPWWWDRDRFVLSAGHGSALLYSLLHLTGYDMSLDDIKHFRQWDSKTPGHPEFEEDTGGVEATTGPLGQGISNAVGMAIAEAHLGARFNKPDHAIIDHYTYVLASDGDLMEGVASEAGSLAGHLGLGKLIALYDNNHVTLSASTNVAFSEDVGARYRAYGWHVQDVADGNDIAAIERAIQAAKDVVDRPSLILVKTVLGFGSPKKAGSYEAHGNPLGPDEVAATKKNLGWPAEPAFLVPPEAAKHLSAVERGAEAQRAWQARYDAYAKQFPELARELERRFAKKLPPGWSEKLPAFSPTDKPIATRKAGEAVMQALAQTLPELIGGSGDLDPSTFTWLKNQGDFVPSNAPLQDAQGLLGGGSAYAGRNIHFGVREHAMGAAVNGMAYHGGLIPYGATFLVFSDYMRPTVRLAAISKLHSIFVFTHDSIGVGEDGPTHQPIEHLAALRAIPNLLVIRPCDANETRWAWQVAIEQNERPTALIFTRQNLPILDRSRYAPAEQLRRGAYVLNASAAAETPDIILISTGSEVELITAAEPRLREKGLKVRLVSMPCTRLFEEQPPEYREQVLPSAVTARLAVEAGSPFGWERYTGLQGGILGLDRFGASAPGPTIYEKLGFTVDNVVDRALSLVRR